MIFQTRERLALRHVVGELLEVSPPHVSIPSLDVSCFSHTPISKRTQPCRRTSSAGGVHRTHTAQEQHESCSWTCRAPADAVRHYNEREDNMTPRLLILIAPLR
jgi:hypothetical protein